MFPIRAQRKLHITPVVTYALIALNVLIFLWELSLGSGLGSAFRGLALIPCDAGLNLETLLDSTRTLFLHASWVHVIGNMLFLLVFGPHLEQFMGRLWFAGLYFVVGYAGNFAHWITHANQCTVPMLGGNVPVVGASGAVFGLLGAFMLLFPATRIQMMVFFLRMPVGLQDVPAFMMLLYMFAIDLIDGITSLGANTVTTSGVAVWAHVGGFLMGMAFAFFFTAFVKPLPPLERD